MTNRAWFAFSSVRSSPLDTKPPQGFTDSLEASSYLDSNDPDLITLDICMPGLDGYGLLDAFARSAPPTPSCPSLPSVPSTTLRPARRRSKPEPRISW